MDLLGSWALIVCNRFEGQTRVLRTVKKAGKRGFSWMDFVWIRP